MNPLDAIYVVDLHANSFIDFIIHFRVIYSLQFSDLFHKNIIEFGFFEKRYVIDYQYE